MQITILEYDPAWPRAFQRIKEELMTALDTIPIISIEHVGSTSVPGLAAKPIIDMDIIVEPKYLPASCSALSTNGYTYNPEPGGIDRMSFRYNKHTHDSGATRPTEDGEIRRAVYVNIPDGVALKNHLVVRKVLSECPELVLEYAEVKRNLAKQPFESIGKYGGAKNAILQKVLSKGDFEDDEVVAIRLFNGVRNTGTYQVITILPAVNSSHSASCHINCFVQPGSGKSTLMKFLLSTAKKRIPLDTVISFFFHARGDDLQKSLEGVYRSLLHQLFTAFPQLKSTLDTLSAAQSFPQTWPLDTLKGLFHDTVLSLDNFRLTCFIDALCERHEDEIRNLIHALRYLSQIAVDKKVDFHVCFASRHYPYITMGECQHLTLDGQEGHEHDISGYIANKLAGKGKVMSDIRTEVQARAQGVFLWAVLVLQILNKEHDRGRNAHQLRCRLNDIPIGLYELFQDFLQRGVNDHDAHQHLLRILQWVLYAQRPLSPEELYFAIHSGISDPVCLEPWNSEEIELQTIHLFILNSSKGLTEVTRGKRVQKNTVKFIHESVRDYLRESGLESISSTVGVSSKALAHEYLKQCCLSLLAPKVTEHPSIPQTLPKAKSEEAKERRSTISAFFRFLEYSASSIVHHSDKVQSNGISQVNFLREFSLSTWININNIFATADTRRYEVKTTTVTSIYTKPGTESLLALALDENIDSSALEFEYALQSALTANNLEAFAMVLSANRGTKSKGHFLDGNAAALVSRREWLRTCRAMKGAHTLEWAIREGKSDTLKAILIHGWREFPGLVSVEDYGNLVIAATSTSQVPVVQVLLETPREIEYSNSSSSGCSHSMIYLRESMRRAANDSSELVLRLMDAHFGSYNEYSDSCRIVLTDMCERGQEGSVRALLGIGKGVNLGGAQLLAAGQNGHLEVVRLLLDRSADVDGDDLLKSVFQDGDLALIQLLLKRCADVKRGNPLDSTVESGNLPVIQLLLEKGADVYRGKSLELVVQDGNFAVAQLLVETARMIHQSYDFSSTGAQFPLPPFHSFTQPRRATSTLCSCCSTEVPIRMHAIAPPSLPH